MNTIFIISDKQEVFDPIQSAVGNQYGIRKEDFKSASPSLEKQEI